MNLLHKLGAGALIVGTAIVLHPSQHGIYPDVLGAINPAITQANLTENICAPRGTWSTKQIRPSTSVTNKIKLAKMKAQGIPASDASLYELDHEISLEISGAPASVDNLWLEKWDNLVNGENLGAHTKDKYENFAHKQVCDGEITLKEAQRRISTDWVYWYHESLKN